jgi:dienelactone hydrolase
MGSEGRTGTSGASQVLDGVTWAAAENDRQGSEYYHKIDTAKVAVMGQSCGGGQAIDLSLDPRVTTSVILNSGAGAPAARTADERRTSGPGLGNNNESPGPPR